MKLLDDYFAIQQQVFDYFGYVEDWRRFVLDDQCEQYWRLDGEGPGTLYHADSEPARRAEAIGG